ncbi:CLUMA_CG021443, isoform A [Clunio marinus]|uniref:CLUMA_CG021443, isoform A n=1 Tax=Clunio marinus TaxID=568069 RepID=A0A1J1J8T5_9DIPT|nr:CLUMA_CG021443, isoform A [Clunio marinus]
MNEPLPIWVNNKALMPSKSQSILDTGRSLRAAKRAMILTQFQTSIAGQVMEEGESEQHH